MEYQLYVTCGECGEVLPGVPNAGFVNRFDHYVCARCGSRKRFKDVVKKWISTSSTFKPSTWGTGYYVDREGNRLPDVVKGNT